MRKDGAANPLEQFAYDVNYIDALAMRWHNADTDDDHTDGDDGEQYYLYDASFNVIALLDKGGAVLERYRYTPYGERIVLDANFANASSSSSYGNQRGFQGLLHDEESGLIENRARMLDPLTGRFMQRDPLIFSNDFGSKIWGRKTFAGVIDITDKIDQITKEHAGKYGYEAGGTLPGPWLGYVDGSNLYELDGGSPVDRWDPMGLTWKEKVVAKGGWAGKIACAVMVYKRVGMATPPTGYTGRADAFAHCVLSCEIAKNCGDITSYLSGAVKELSDLFGPHKAEFRDMLNNATGIGCGQLTGISCRTCCKNRLCPKF